MGDFKQDCEPLGKLPAPPASYRQVDQFLKLAYAEVTQADEELSALLDGKDNTLLTAEHLKQGMQHLVKFIEFAKQIEEALSGLGQRKEI